MAKKRPGGTEKISISLPRAELAVLRRRAKKLFDGNLSAVFAELAADAVLLEGMDRLIESMGGPILTDDDRAELSREVFGDERPRRRRVRKSA